MSETLGNNAPAAPVSTADSSSAIAQLQAQLKAGEALLQPIVEGTDQQPPATAPVQTPPDTAATPQNGNKDSVQQFRDKEGNVDPQKIEKANENLTAATLSKEERLAKLLETNKELMRKHTKVSQELKTVEKEVTPAYDVNPERISKEFREKLQKDLEEDAPAAIARLVHSMNQQALDARLAPIEAERRQGKEEARHKAMVNDMDALVDKGHHWLLTPEGGKRLSEIFEARPYLLESKTPYTDALTLAGIAPDGPQSGKAPPTPPTPTLGGYNAVPPPSAPRTASPVDELETLAKDSRRALADGNIREATKIQKRMEEVYRAANPDRM